EDGDDLGVRALLRGLPATVAAAGLSIAAGDKWGAGERRLVDHAAYHHRLDAMAALLEAGARPSPRLLHLAIANYGGELAEIAVRLIRGGADPEAAHDGLTPLMRAAIARDANIVRALLERGAERNRKDPAGRIAAQFAPGGSDLQRLLEPGS
ncbi:MAG: ankyrin repeat domain-containing protein, partial [Alphaproteobacteria bacterium]|nr:ankyrin repeat domain-containing protein [Alphaproteobacteria bacterium]